MSCFDNSPLAVHNLTEENSIPQGADWSVAIRYLENGAPVDFSGGTAVMQVRTDYDKDVILELSTADGTIALGSGAGTTPNVILTFRAAATSAMTQYEGIYDLEVSLAGVTYKFIEGKFELHREVTK